MSDTVEVCTRYPETVGALEALFDEWRELAIDAALRARAEALEVPVSRPERKRATAVFAAEMARIARVEQECRKALE